MRDTLDGQDIWVDNVMGLPHMTCKIRQGANAFGWSSLHLDFDEVETRNGSERRLSRPEDIGEAHGLT